MRRQPSRIYIPYSTMKIIVVLSALVALVAGHGRLREPPARSSAWRYGFGTPQNYDDTELFCGGFTRQHDKNGGKCGICGDAWDLPEPRPNELGGTFAPGVITRRYKRGQVIDTHIQLTQNHLGWYELRLCSIDGNNGKDATQECLNQHILERADGSGNRIPIPSGINDYQIKMKLPDDVTCEHCVLQWDWVTGNRWDFCGTDGSGALGCGPQETFRGCADISIE